MKFEGIHWSATALLLLACGGPSSGGQAEPAEFPQGQTAPAGPEAREFEPPAQPTKRAEANTVRVEPDPQCHASGPEQEVRGKLERRDLGHQVEGLFLQSADERWLLSYGIPEDLTPLIGSDVIVTGTPCTRHGRAIVGAHFNPTRVQRAE
ncbi:MAG: hypothetical protein H6716_21680 [Polyangiaceae bacterium]|nr:hypothetical protein [Polyangiaceae bacterium]